MTTSEMAPPKAASLLGLPRELRDEVWTLTLVSKHAMPDLKAGAAGAVLITAAPALLHTCRQIRAEASSIFYKQTFEVLGSVGPKLQESMEWIRIHAAAMPANVVKIGVPYILEDPRSPDEIARLAYALERFARTLDTKAQIKVRVVDMLRQRKCNPM